MLKWLSVLVLTSCWGVVAADEQEADQAQFKTLPGMSILGNNEAPKSLVIVPWKSSEIGDGIGVADSLDDRALPVDRDVFVRELNYYNLRSKEVSPASGR